MDRHDNIFRLGVRAANEKVGPEDLFTAQQSQKSAAGRNCLNNALSSVEGTGNKGGKAPCRVRTVLPTTL